MFKSYLLISFRSIWKKRGVAFVNLVCLALGMATALFIFNYAQHEFSFDQYHEDWNQIYRVETNTYFRQEIRKTDALSPFLAGNKLLSNREEIIEYARLVTFSESGSAFVVHKNANGTAVTTHINKAYYADDQLLSILSIPFFDKPGRLHSAQTVVISKVLAERICKEYQLTPECVIGTTIFTKDMGKETQWTITGILEDLPQNTHLQFDVLFSLKGNEDLFRAGQDLNTYTYVKANAELQLFDFNQSLLDKEELTQFSYLDRSFQSLRPISEIHLSPDVSNSIGESTSYTFVFFMSITGLIILLLTATNFVNSSIIRSIERSKEIGVRRLVGIKPKQLMTNVLLESFVFNVLAAVLAFMFFVLAINTATTLEDLSYPTSFDQSTIFISLGLLTTLIIISTLLSAYFPAKLLMNLKPVEALKGSNQIVRSKQSNRGSGIMRGLLIFQLAISTVFISGMYIVQRQLIYAKENDSKTFRMSLTAKFPGLSGANEIYAEMAEAFMNESIRNGRVQDIYVSNTYNGQIKNKQVIKGLRPIGTDTSFIIPDFNLYVVDYKFFSGLDTNFTGGRNFTYEFGYDYDGVIVNESALKAMGLSLQDNVIGKRIGPYNGTLKIIGVYRDQVENEVPKVYVTGFRYPVYFNLTMNTAGNSAEKLRAVVNRAQRIMNEQFGNTYIISRVYEDQFKFEEALVKLFYFFTGLTVVVSALGIYALSTFTALKRTKEVGIRKILGARVSQILVVLTTDFLRLMGIGVAIAFPITYIIARRWLEDYAYRIDLNLSVFLVPILSMILLSLIIVVRQCWSTSILSPLKSLRAD